MARGRAETRTQGSPLALPRSFHYLMLTLLLFQPSFWVLRATAGGVSKGKPGHGLPEPSKSQIPGEAGIESLAVIPQPRNPGPWKDCGDAGTSGLGDFSWEGGKSC